MPTTRRSRRSTSWTLKPSPPTSEFGFEDLPNGTVRLRCRGENEALMYEGGLRHTAFSRLNAVKCPVVIACGAESHSFGPG